MMMVNTRVDLPAQLLIKRQALFGFLSKIKRR